MGICLKSESRAVFLGLATVVVLPFLPRRTLFAAIPLWALASRFVSGGARCKVRPAKCSDPKEMQSEARFVMSQDMSDSDRPVAVVTGTNSGIGYFTAVELAAEGFIVVATCRSLALTKQNADRIRTEAQRRRRANPRRYADTPSEIKVIGECSVECDDFSSIHSFAKWFTERFGSGNVQVLVNNAGGMRSDLTFSQFNEQLELHTAVNFLGPLLLTELLLPTLEKNGGRVVYVSSEAHRFPQAALDGAKTLCGRRPASCNGMIHGRLLEALKQLNRGISEASGPLQIQTLGKCFIRYGTSKLLNTYHAHEIARRYANVSDERHRVYACSLHPGCVSTGFSRDLLRRQVFSTLFQYAGLLFLKNGEEGAQTTLHCAMCPRSELELVAPAPKEGKNPCRMDEAVSPYFVECSNATESLLQAYGWDVKEGESIVSWGRHIVGLPS